MRTNIVLDDHLVQEAMRYTTSRTKRALVEEALRTFVGVKEAERRRASYGERVAAVQKKTSSLRFRKSSAELLREDRERP